MTWLSLQPPAFIDYASVLPLALDEARRVIGVSTLETTHPCGLPTAGGTLRGLGCRVTIA